MKNTHPLLSAFSINKMKKGMVFLFSFSLLTGLFTNCDRPTDSKDISVLRQELQIAQEQVQKTQQQLKDTENKLQVAEGQVTAYKQQLLQLQKQPTPAPKETNPSQPSQNESKNQQLATEHKIAPTSPEETKANEGQIEKLKRELEIAQVTQREIAERNQVLERENKEQLDLLEAAKIACPIPGLVGKQTHPPLGKDRKTTLLTKKLPPIKKPPSETTPPVELITKNIPKKDPADPTDQSNKESHTGISDSTNDVKKDENPTIVSNSGQDSQVPGPKDPTIPSEVKPDKNEPKDPIEIVQKIDPVKEKEIKKLRGEKAELEKECSSKKQEAEDLIKAKIDKVQTTYLKLVADPTNDPKVVCPTCQIPKAPQPQPGKLKELWNKVTKKGQPKSCSLQNPSACTATSPSTPSSLPTGDELAKKRVELVEKAHKAMKKEEQLLIEELKTTLLRITKECTTQRKTIQKKIDKLTSS